MCNFCGEIGKELLDEGDEEPFFDMGSFLDMCASEASGKKKTASAYDLEDVFAALPVNENAMQKEDVIAEADIADLIAERQQKITAVSEWAAAELELAGFGKGRLVSVQCPEEKTSIALLDASAQVEVHIFKCIDAVEAKDVQSALRNELRMQKERNDDADIAKLLAERQRLAERQQKIAAVSEWAAAEFELAGFGKGRLVSVQCTGLKTLISLLDESVQVQFQILKGIDAVEATDVQSALRNGLRKKEEQNNAADIPD